MKSLYDEEYYERGIENGKSCYTNYRWIPELTIPMAARLIEHLHISEEDKILDFGCAKGYLVKAFRLLHREAFGFDISSYALSSAPDEVKAYISNEITAKYNWIIAKDVFEHISYEDIGKWLKELSLKTEHMFVIVPLGYEGKQKEKKYIIPAYELDSTHVIREDLLWWSNLFEKNGFRVKEATYNVKYIKENWSKWDKGNGFFILDSEGIGEHRE